MKFPKLSALFFGAPAKTAGKRAVKFKTLCKQRLVPANQTQEARKYTITNHSDESLYITVSVDFTKAGKK